MIFILSRVLNKSNVNVFVVAINMQVYLIFCRWRVMKEEYFFCKIASPCESHSNENFFAQWFEKVLVLCLVRRQSQNTQLSGSWGKNGVWKCIFCVREPLLPKSCKIFRFLFCLNGFGFINFESQKRGFPIVFNMFVNMFWIAEGFGYIGCRLNIGLSTIFVWYLALSNKN